MSEVEEGNPGLADIRRKIAELAERRPESPAALSDRREEYGRGG